MLDTLPRIIKLDFSLNINKVQSVILLLTSLFFKDMK